MAARPTGLGRGLGALIRDGATPSPVEKAPQTAGAVPLAITSIRTSPWQPRRVFEAGLLADLVASVRERGVLQPLLVRRIKDGFELIAGERRWRAAGEAGLKEVPALILDVSDRDALEIALVENIQRADLNLIEEAEGYRALAVKFSLTQEEIARRVGKARPTVANAMRLLDLADGTKRLVAERQLSPGHAKVLLAVSDAREQERLANEAVAGSLSVRELERRIRAQARGGTRKKTVTKADLPEAHLRHLSEQLHQKLGTAVRIEPTRTLPNGRKTKGRLEIDFHSADELDRILVILGVAGDL